MHFITRGKDPSKNISSAFGTAGLTSVAIAAPLKVEDVSTYGKPPEKKVYNAVRAVGLGLGAIGSSEQVKGLSRDVIPKEAETCATQFVQRVLNQQNNSTLTFNDEDLETERNIVTGLTFHNSALDSTSDVSSVDGVGAPVKNSRLDIVGYGAYENKKRMRALLDTEAAGNFISQRCVEDMGCEPIELKEKKDYITVNGHTVVKPKHFIQIQMRFTDNNPLNSHKFYTVELYVVEQDVGFDVILGREFIFSEELFKWNATDLLLVLGEEPETDEQRQKRKENSKQKKQQNSADHVKLKQIKAADRKKEADLKKKRSS